MTVAGPLLAEDHDQPYEYRTYRVGDRVRVRLSPECTHKRLFMRSGLSFPSHHPLENGQVGTVFTLTHLEESSSPAHHIGVEFDRPFPISQWDFAGRCWFASSELEPLDPEVTQ